MEQLKDGEYLVVFNNKNQSLCTEDEIINGIKNGTLRKNNLVWSKGFENWKEINDTEFRKFFGPPPLPSKAINNLFIWIIAFYPLLLLIINKIFDFRTVATVILYITLIIAILCVIDKNIMKKAGYSFSSWIYLAIIFVIPLYIFLRSKKVKMYSPLITYLVCFVIAIFL